MTDAREPQRHPRPSARARALVRGAYDVHVHAAPDIVPRHSSDLEVAARCRAVGLAGFVLKSHHTPTAERAQVVGGVTPGVEVFGSVTLNASVGGVNPMAVEVAARSGARVVWLPTVDARNQRSWRGEVPGAHAPLWSRLQDDMALDGVSASPVDVVGPDGGLRPETEAVLRLVTRHGLALATGHLGLDETRAVVEAAARLGLTRVIVTHPEFSSQRFGVADQRELAGMGALLERCFGTAYAGRASWEEVIDTIMATGPERSLLSSDLGQPFNPPVEDGLALFADRLLAAGVSEDAIRAMAVDNTGWVLSRVPRPPGLTGPRTRRS